MEGNEQFKFGHADEVRKELTPKIDEKISNTSFYSILGFFVVILIAVFGYAFSLINSTNTDIRQLTTKIAVLESKVEDKKN